MNYTEWSEKWLNNYIKTSNKARTTAIYTQTLKQHIIPHFGKIELEDISPYSIQEYISYLLEHGNLKTGGELSPSSVNSILTILQGSLKTAASAGYLKNYTSNLIKRPQTQEKKIEAFTLQEQKQIENFISTRNRPSLYGVILCLYTGLRIGELLALEWSDIDFKQSVMKVNKTCYYTKDDSQKYVRITTTPKTSSSLRTIPIPEKLKLMLSELKKRSRSIYVISNGEKSIQMRSYQQSFSLILKKLSIPHKGFHSLRHTFATRAIESGMDVKTLSEILGHKSTTVTLNRYVHSLSEHKKEMMNNLCKFL